MTDLIDLPPPDLTGGGSLTAALAGRRSVRDFRPEALNPAQVSQLLWATQGVTSDDGRRTAPSAGALYPLELYLVTERGHYHYDPDRHGLVVLGRSDLRGQLCRAALSQDAVGKAAAVFVLAAAYSRTERKYGDRSERYVKLDTGHAAQNLLLQADSLGLGAVPMGAFDDNQVREVLGLPDELQPLYLIPVGFSAE